jgi:hypothetical protein
MGQSLDERAEVVCRVKTAAVLVCELRIEVVRAGPSFELGEVIQLSLASSLHPSAGKDFSGHHLLGVLPCDLGWL